MLHSETVTPTTPRSLWQRAPLVLRLGSATAFLAFLIYALTLPRDLTWAHFGADGGELITAAVTLGIPHPPGYPTYVLLGHLAALLPLGNVALRLNLFSALAVALAAGVTAIIAFEHTHGNRIAALATGLTLAFMPLVWSQALIAEVYGLNLLVVALFLWALLGQRPFWLTGLFLGLSLTTHLTSLLLLPLAVALTPRRGWGKLMRGMLLGLTPLLVLPLLARGDSPVIWGDATTLQGWWWLVSGHLYRANLQLPANLVNHLSAWSAQLLSQLAWIGFILLPIGVVAASAPRRKIVWLLGTSLAYALYSLAYQTNDAFVHFMPGMLLLSPLLAAGLDRLGYASLIMPLALLLLNGSALNTASASVRPQATHLLAEAPQNAILLTPGNRTIFTLWYFHHIEGLRPDVVVVDSNLLAFDWYRQRLSGHYPSLLGLEKDDLAAFRGQNAAQWPFCEADLYPKTQLRCSEK